MAELLGLTGIIGLVIGVMLALGIVAFAAGILGWFAPVEDEGSLNNFNNLVLEIKKLIRDKDNLDSAVVDFYLKDDAIVVGYDHNKDKQRSDCWDEGATKPVDLFGKAGLCLHLNDNVHDFDDDPRKPVKCEPFDDKIIFLAPYDGDDEGGFGGSKKSVNVYGKQEDYEDLFLYGDECDTTYDLGVTKLYIEKFKKGEEIYIYINEYNEKTEKANRERFARLKKELLTP